MADAGDMLVSTAYLQKYLVDFGNEKMEANWARTQRLHQVFEEKMLHKQVLLCCHAATFLPGCELHTSAMLGPVHRETLTAITCNRQAEHRRVQPLLLVCCYLASKHVLASLMCHLMTSLQ